MSEVWTRWEGQMLNGVLPLRRFLGGGDRSGVFLTEYAAQNLPDAVVKLVPVAPTVAEAQLAQWRTAASLSHPHLIRVFDSGRCELGELEFLFVVMEYAEQNLAEIIARRALTADEVREMLVPILDALAYLHRSNLVHGRLKPSNILAVDDRLKLASDTVRTAGATAIRRVLPSVYDPPEASDGSFSPAGDIWSLGVTMVEALTQHPPASLDKGSEGVSLPATLPPTFQGIVRRCLNRNPADRPTAAGLASPIKVSPQTATAPVSQPVAPPPAPVASEVSHPATPSRVPPKQSPFALAVELMLLIGIVVWAGLRLINNHGSSQQSAPSTAHTSAQPAPAPPPAADSTVPAPAPASAFPYVVHEELPDISHSAQQTIRGHLWVAVRVRVNPSGEVIGATLEDAAPSKYFAQKAIEAASKWRFAPADNQPYRYWRIRFEFTRAGTTVHATSPWS